MGGRGGGGQEVTTKSKTSNMTKKHTGERKIKKEGEKKEVTQSTISQTMYGQIRRSTKCAIQTYKS